LWAGYRDFTRRLEGFQLTQAAVEGTLDGGFVAGEFGQEVGAFAV
jgi:hypothetical protein